MSCVALAQTGRGMEVIPDGGFDDGLKAEHLVGRHGLGRERLADGAEQDIR